MRLALIGAGQRGMVYSNYAFHSKKAEIAAVVEPDKDRRENAAREFNIPPDRQYISAADFFGEGRI